MLLIIGFTSIRKNFKSSSYLHFICVLYGFRCSAISIVFICLFLDSDKKTGVSTHWAWVWENEDLKNRFLQIPPDSIFMSSKYISLRLLNVIKIKTIVLCSNYLIDGIYILCNWFHCCHIFIFLFLAFFISVFILYPNLLPYIPKGQKHYSSNHYVNPIANNTMFLQGTEL